jgi:N-acyl-D-aspartate/D-glutamate deacylase
VPHDALRVYVMGERSAAEMRATPEDIAEMRRIVREAVEAGAAGFSTGRSDNHRSAKGEWTPSSEAAAEELAGIAEAFKGLDFGVLQAVSDFDIMHGDERFEREFALLEGMVRAAGGRPMSISTMQRDHSKNQWKWILERAEKLVAEGFNVRCQVAPRGIGVILGLQATFHPFMGYPSYKAISHLPLEARVAAMREPGFKERILSEKSEKVAGDGSMLPPLADFFLQNLQMIAFRLFRLGEIPNYEPSAQDSFGFEAMQKKEPIMSLLFDAMLERDGKALIYFPVYNYTDMNLDNVYTMLTHPLAIPGLSDGGAHVGTICDASFSTFLLTHWARDRQKARLDLERVVHMQTKNTADYIGLTDRGVIAVGKKADLNVIDFNHLRLRAPEIVRDLPAGGQRLLQRAEGYVATLVSGQVILENGVLTKARPGRLVRAGR